MSRKIYKYKWHLLFWLIYIGYSHVYQLISFPEDRYPFIVWFLHYGSFVAVFYFSYFSTKQFFNQNNRISKRIILLFLAGIISIYGLQFIKNYYILNVKSFYFVHYLNLFGEVFLVFTMAVFFGIIEYTEKFNQLNYNSLMVNNEKMLFLNRSNRNKKIVMRLLEKISFENASNKVNVEFQIFKELVNFMINNTHKSLITLDLEIENLHKYLKLYKLRSLYANNFQINITGELKSWEIPHKTILTLVENTIKHGDLSQPITIIIDSLQSCLNIAIKNKINPQSSVVKSTNMGLENLMARLELHLKNRHKFEVINKDGFFEVYISVF